MSYPTWCSLPNARMSSALVACAALWMMGGSSGCDSNASKSPPSKTVEGGSLAARDDASAQIAKPGAVAADAWHGQLVGVEGDGVVELRARTSTEWRAVRAGEAIEAGAGVRTDGAARARLMVTPGDGEVVLNHSSELDFMADRPGIALKKGHAIVTTPHEFNVERRLPGVVLPTGAVELAGTRVAAIAGEQESFVAVAQGEVLATSHTGEEQRARFGQEVVLRAGKPIEVIEAPDLAQQFAWREADRRDVTLPQLERGMGKLIARRPNTEQERTLILSDHKIDVRIQGMMAYTEITEVFYNPSQDRMEGIYRFPLPEDAQISRLSLLVGDRWMEGQFLETARAEAIWRDVTIERQMDPALLKWQQGNQFELRIFPIEPASSRKVTIGYVQRLEPTGDGYRYVYPMPMDRSGQSEAKRFELRASVQGHDTTHDVVVEGYTGAEVKREGETARVSMERKDFRPSGDLGLRVMLPVERREARAFAFKEADRPGEEGYMAVSLRPQFGGGAEVKGRDFVIVLDSSYGRRGATMALQAALLKQLVEEIDPLDRVRVIACAASCESLDAMAWQQARETVADGLYEKAKALESWGSTYTLEAVRSAARILEQREDRSREAHIIYVTDGVTSAGPSHPASLEAGTRRLLEPLGARLNVVGLGGDEDLSNQRALARGGRGEVIKLRAGDSMVASALHVLRRHYGASLQDITLELPAGIRQVYPSEISSLLPGEELLLVGRLKERVEGDVVLRASTGGKPVTLRFPVVMEPRTDPGLSFVTRLWARHRIEALEAQGGDHRAEIVKLSQRFGILTRYTTLLALESDEMMRDYGVSHQRHTDWKGEAASSEDEESGPLAAGQATKRTGDSASRSQHSDDLNIGASASGSAESPKKSSPRDMLTESTRDSRPKPASAPDSDLRKSERGASDEPLTRFNRKPRERRKSCYAQRVINTSQAQAPTKSELDRLDRAWRAMEGDPKNRTKRMTHIRTAMRAHEGGQAAASQAIEAWLELNPMDPEAVVLRGQVALNAGDVATATRWLFSAPDAAARAPWLLERVKLAAAAIDDEAMACAYAQTLNDISLKRDASVDPLRCSPSTKVTALLAGTAQPETPQRGRSYETPRGALVVTAEWDDPNAELDLVIVEPDGRLLSWMSQRHKLKVRGARDRGFEQLILPSLKSGDYAIRVVRVDGGAQRGGATGAAPQALPVTLKVRLNNGKEQRFERRISALSEEVLELRWTSREVCR